VASSTSLRLPAQLKAEVTAYADALGLSLNALCAVALRDYLDQRKRPPAPQPAPLPSAQSSPSPTLAGGGAAAASVAKAPAPILQPKTQQKPTLAQQGMPGTRWQVPKVPGNSPCPCGSGRKYKKCCGVPAYVP
jgi:hypothetical protein